MAYSNNTPKVDVYQIVTVRIMELLIKGVVPWKKTWKGNFMANVPCNAITKKPYRGMNQWLLAYTGHASNLFLTYNQAKKLGGNVKKGEKGFPVVFWKFLQKDEYVNGVLKKKTIPFLRYFTVFNIEQCENITLPKTREVKQIDFSPIEEAEKVWENYNEKPELKFNGQQAFYAIGEDFINMPVKDSFVNKEAFYATLFHEMIHSTGAKKRLDRDFGTSFGNDKYSKEELVAEMGSCFLCNIAQINTVETEENSAAYIQGWLKKLKDDKKFLVSAASQAQKACDHILGIKFTTEEENEE